MGWINRVPGTRAPAPVPDLAGTGATDVELPRLVLDHIPVGVVVVSADDRVVLVNAAARRLGLVSEGALIGPMAGFLLDARREREAAGDAELPVAGWPPGRLDVRVQAVRLADFPDAQVAILVEDVTEARRVEAMRRDFVANVGHEIKTPVGAVALLAEAAQEAADDPPAVLHFVGRIRHEAARLARLVTELIDLSRLQGGEALPEPVPVSLDAVVAEAVDRVAPAAQAKRIKIVVAAAAGAKVGGNERQLVTAVANLLDNAVAYSPEGTRVAVATKRRERVWELSVTDQGIGIPAADLERIFERFYRVDPARSRATGGTGLGLAIVKHIVHNHGGEIRVWSTPGAGSTFTLRLPVLTEPDQPASTGAAR